MGSVERWLPDERRIRPDFCLIPSGVYSTGEPLVAPLRMNKTVLRRGLALVARMVALSPSQSAVFLRTRGSGWAREDNRAGLGVIVISRDDGGGRWKKSS